MKKPTANTAFLFVIFACFSNGVFAQITGTVKSKQNEPIPFATVRFIDASGGTYCDSVGNFLLPIEKTADSILVSAIGYQSEIYSVPSNNLLQIVLIEDTVSLPEVVVKSVKNTIQLGGITGKNTQYIGMLPSSIIARYLENKTPAAATRIKTIVIPIKKKIRFSTNQGLFRVHLYTANGPNVQPGAELLTKDYVHSASDFDKVIKIDISEEGISLPASGVFIGLEWLGTPSLSLDAALAERKAGSRAPNVLLSKHEPAPYTWVITLFANNPWFPMDTLWHGKTDMGNFVDYRSVNYDFRLEVDVF